MGAGDEARTAHCDPYMSSSYTVTTNTRGPDARDPKCVTGKNRWDKPHGERATVSRIKVHGMVYTAAG